MVLGGHIEITGLGRMVGGLFGNVVAFRSIWEIPIASEGLPKKRVKGLLHSSMPKSVLYSGDKAGGLGQTVV